MMTGDPGSGTSCAATADALPADGLLIGADFGYLEAYTMHAMGGADSLIGVATVLSVSMGIASSYNATALVGFNAMDDAAATVNAGGEGTLGQMGTAANIQMALAREGGVDKEVLLGRWTASTMNNSRTIIVLTFPGSGQPGMMDPITSHVYNETEDDNLSPRSLILGQEVNVCTFWNMNDTGNNRVALECNGGDKLLVDFEEGWFRILNNSTATTELDSVAYAPATRLPVIGLQFSTFEGVMDASFDQSYPIQWMAETGAGATDASSGNAYPWYVPGGPAGMIEPGDNMTGGLPLK
jgi:hypothetical protein